MRVPNDEPENLKILVILKMARFLTSYQLLFNILKTQIPKTSKKETLKKCVAW